MSSEIGAISQYALSVQQMQLSLIKANIDLQKQAIEVLLGDDSRVVSPSATLGKTSTSQSDVFRSCLKTLTFR